MKTLNLKKLASAAAMLVFMAAPALASGKLMVSPYMKTNYAIVSAVVANNEGARLAIKDEVGNVLYRSHRINNVESFQKLIDISTLPNGTYKVYLEGKSVKEVNTFTIKNNKLVIDGKTEAGTTASFYRKNTDMLYVRHINPASKSSTLFIYDNNGETIYASMLPNKETYNALYKINELPRGQYKMVLIAGANTHSYEFKK
jgi:hypothetical protein